MRIALDLGGQDRRCRADVAESGVRLLMLPVEVEACGCGEIPRLLTVKDSLHVDHPPTPVVEVEVGSLELSDQHRQVEAPDIETPEVTGVDQLEQRFGASSEGFFVREVLVGNPVDRGRFGRNGDARFEAPDPFHHVALRRNSQDRHLDDAILLGAQSGGLQVEENERPVELDGQEHQDGCRTGCIALS